MPPKKLKTDVSYVESIDFAKFPCPPFYLTKVSGIADTHNSPDVAIGIKGKLYFVYISMCYKSYDMLQIFCHQIWEIWKPQHRYVVILYTHFRLNILNAP